MKLLGSCLLLCTLTAADLASANSIQSIESFARMPHMRSVSISPNGQRIAFVSAVGDESVAVTFERNDPAASTRTLFRAEASKFDIEWCRWANDERLLCGLEGVEATLGRYHPTLRIIGVNADGTNLRALVGNPQPVHRQYRDRIVDWTPDKPESVLIQVSEANSIYPTVFEMNVNDGTRTVHTKAYGPIRSFMSDAQGHVRLGAGAFYGRDETVYLARLDGQDKWQQISEVAPLTASAAPRLIAMGSKPNSAYAIGSADGRAALFEIDLDQRAEPQKVFAHPSVDVDEPLLDADGRLLGVFYQKERRQIQYVDAQVRSIMEAVDRARPQMLNVLVDSSRDGRIHVIRSSSDLDPGTYFLLDSSENKLQEIGKDNPDLIVRGMHTQWLSYKAKDGVEIPAYITMPATEQMENLPLIVMPHDGPLAIASLEYSFLRAFLVDRGYAVLQMSYRGSAGYGDEWRLAGHQDWAGVSYSDITDGARRAIESGLADPKQLCIVGWGFGGYAALLSAVRDSELYQCAVSIAGISDLNDLMLGAYTETPNLPYSTLAAGVGGDTAARRSEALRSELTGGFTRARPLTGYYTRPQIGSSVDQLRKNSPAQLADQVRIPILLVHGEKDARVDAEQSRRMESALQRAKKPHRAVYLKGGSHDLARKSERASLLSELETFLREHMGAARSGS